MEITTADRTAAVHKVWGAKRVRLFCKRTPENEARIHRIQESVWHTCEVAKFRSNTKWNQETCQVILEREPHYQDSIKFIPWMFLLQIILPIVIKFLIDMFLEKKAKQPA